MPPDDGTSEGTDLDAGLFRDAFKKIAVPAAVTRLDTGEFIDANLAFTEVLGWTVDEVVGKSALDLGILVDADVRARLVDEVRHHGFVKDTEVDIRTKSGELVRALVSLDAIHTADEVVLLGTFHDVTARHTLQAALRGQEELVRAILDAAADAIVGLDPSNRVTLVNDAGASMLGYEPHELVGRNFHDVAHHSRLDGTPYPGDECPVYQTTQRAQSHRVEGEVFWRRDGSPVPVEYTASPVIVNGEVVGATVVARDVTAQIESRWVLEESIRRTETASRAKTEFLSHMSHELRTPLNAILGFTELLTMRVTDPDIAADLQQIERAGHHLLDLVNDALDVTRIEVGRLVLSVEPTSLRQVVAEVTSLLGHSADDAGVTLRTGVLPDSYVDADVQRLRQVFLNLVSNAIKYNRPGGWVEVDANSRGERVEVAVRDSGLGISPARLARLFEPFERITGDRSGVEGTGLGLALSQRLVHAMHGSLHVESVEGEGSVFTVTLDRVEPGLPIIESTPSVPPAPPHAQRAVVLYVEDNPANIHLVEAALRTRPGVTLIPAMTGSLGVELALADPPDLVLLDVHLPDMNGEEVLRRLRADDRTRGCRIVVLSADGTKERIQHLLATGADAYLTKPLRLTSLFAEIDGLAAPDAPGEPE